MSGLFRSLIQKMVKVRSNRATSSRNGGRNHLGTPSDIKSECWATSSRIRGRLPSESAHCDGCGQFLGNPLTVDGLICVENMIRDYLTTKKAATDAGIEWADFYKGELDFRRIVLEALKG